MDPTGVTRGTQIAYIPLHVREDLDQLTKADLDHRDVQFGFATSVRGETVFCRYWRAGQPGDALRTRGNSEGCSANRLILHKSATQWEVDAALKGWCNDT